jgi:hypothetical protein
MKQNIVAQSLDDMKSASVNVAFFFFLFLLVMAFAETKHSGTISYRSLVCGI